MPRKRTGILGIKLGMSSMYDKNGEFIPVTLIECKDCTVTSHKTIEKDGYNAVQLGLGDIKQKNITKPMLGHFAKSKTAAKKYLKEFRISEDAFIDLGNVVSVGHFVEGQFVDVQSYTIGKGFAGVIKRHNFGGLEASHGVSISHRSHGSTGQCQDPGKVFKGKKMAGRMGNKKSTVQNLLVMAVSEDQQYIVVKGAVPGAKGALVAITDSVKKALPITAPYPGQVSNKEQVEA